MRETSVAENTPGRTVTPSQVLRFWLPLAFMWLVMGIEQPAISAVVSRMPNPTEGLAALEVGFGLATLIHSPVMQMLAAATALAKGPTSYRRLKKLLWIMIGGLTALHPVLAIPPIFHLLARVVLNVPEPIIPSANLAFLICTPITATVGLRRFYQGALIRAGRTKTASAVMILRLASTTVFLGLMLVLQETTELVMPSGGVVGALAFMIGVGVGAVSARVAVHRSLREQFREDEGPTMSLRAMWRFYLPLALMQVIVLSTRPLAVFAIGRSESPIESLASWPVIHSYLFMFSSIAISYQEVVVARATEHGGANLPVLKKFGYAIAGVLAGLYLLTAVTPAMRLWFDVVLGVPDAILPFVLGGAVILSISPLGIPIFSTRAGILVAYHRTRWITVASAANLIAQLGLGLVLPALTSLDGARVGAIMQATALAAQLAVVWWASAVIVDRRPVNSSDSGIGTPGGNNPRSDETDD